MTEEIAYLDLKKINDRFRSGILARTEQMLDDGRYIGGKWNRRFRTRFADYCGCRFAVGVGNGLDALRIIIQAADLGAGDEIIVPANTFIATILAISQAGCIPILVEPEEETFNIDPLAVEKAITPRTKAIMAVHLYGRVAPMEELRQLANAHGLLLFEDAAQAHGAKLNRIRAGNLAHAAGFSFYPGKNLGCLGDGGMITTNDADLATKAARIANYGSLKKYVHEVKGCNSRLDDFQAAVLDLKLDLLDADNEKRRQIAQFYSTNIHNPRLRLPTLPENSEEHVWHIYPVRVRRREAFQGYMQEMGIETLVHYPMPPHRQGAYPEFRHLALPITETIHREVVSLPLNPILTAEETGRIVETVNGWK